MSLKSTLLLSCHPWRHFLKCQDSSKTITQNNDYVSFSSRIQWTTLTTMDLRLFTNKVHLIWTCKNIWKWSCACMQSWFDSYEDYDNIVRHFISIAFNPHNSLFRQVLTASFYNWGKRDSKKKYELPRSHRNSLLPKTTGFPLYHDASDDD